MSSWTTEERQIVLELAGQKLAREIADELLNKGFKKRTPSAVRNVIRRHGKGIVKDSKIAQKNEVEKQITPIMNVPTEFANALNEMSNIRKEAINSITDYTEHIGNPENTNFKVLSISDTHIPFYHDGVIAEAISNHGDADVLVLNGDLLELHSVSRWPKSKAIMLRHEYAIAMTWLRKLANRFPKIILVKGNHEERLQSYFQANVDPGVSFLTDPDILERLANGYDFNEYGNLVKMHDLPNVQYNGGNLSWFAQIGKCIFAHPTGGSSIPMRTVIKTADYFLGRGYDFDSVVIGHCFDEETELLTNQGWRTINTITDEDKPLTLNLKSNKLEFNDCEGIHIYSNHKELIAFENNTGLEVLVTPEHGMLYSTSHEKSKNWKKANAQEIEDYKRISIPASGILDNPENKSIPDATLKLLAWIVTKGNSKRYEANIFKHNVFHNYDAYQSYIGVEDSNYLKQYLDLETKTFNNNLLMSLSLRQRQLLIEEMCKSDGSKCGTNHYCHYYTSNKRLLDQFQLLCTLSGIRSKANIKREDGTWVVSMTKTDTHTVTSIERRENTGRTWCLTVSNGTLVARRRGVVFLTQNTHKMGTLIWNNKLLIEQGCACVPLEYEATSKMTYRPQAFGYSVMYMDQDGNVDFDKSGPVYYGTGSLTPNNILDITQEKKNG